MSTQDNIDNINQRINDVVSGNAISEVKSEDDQIVFQTVPLADLENHRDKLVRSTKKNCFRVKPLRVNSGL